MFAHVSIEERPRRPSSDSFYLIKMMRANSSARSKEEKLKPIGIWKTITTSVTSLLPSYFAGSQTQPKKAQNIPFNEQDFIVCTLDVA